MADPDSKGGTPIFASPECFEKKDKKSDIFSFGRVILFLLLAKKDFVKWIFVPLKNHSRALSNVIQIIRLGGNDQSFNLVSVTHLKISKDRHLINNSHHEFIIYQYQKSIDQ